jgi:hypothetical protein
MPLPARHLRAVAFVFGGWAGASPASRSPRPSDTRRSARRSPPLTAKASAWLKRPRSLKLH